MTPLYRMPGYRQATQMTQQNTRSCVIYIKKIEVGLMCIKGEINNHHKCLKCLKHEPATCISIGEIIQILKESVRTDGNHTDFNMFPTMVTS